MNRLIITITCCLLFSIVAIGQQNRYNWKIGLHTGVAAYYGDLSHQFWDFPHQFQQPIKDANFLSYGLSVEHHFTKTIGLRLIGMRHQIKASDRTYAASPNYTRALNVQTDIYEANLLATIYFDNGRLLGEKAVLSPYFLIGGGANYFIPKGDLLATDGGRYFYWSDNTIRNMDEFGMGAANAAVIEQDYDYETDLRSLSTEGVEYSGFTWNVAIGLGLKIRLSQRFHLHLEALAHYTGTDFLDDVRSDYLPIYTDNFQAYAAQPSTVTRTARGDSPEMNDFYGHVGLSLHYSFGQKTYPIRPSIIYTNYTAADSSLLVGAELVDTIAATIETDSATAEVPVVIMDSAIVNPVSDSTVVLNDSNVVEPVIVKNDTTTLMGTAVAIEKPTAVPTDTVVMVEDSTTVVDSLKMSMFMVDTIVESMVDVETGKRLDKVYIVETTIMETANGSDSTKIDSTLLSVVEKVAMRQKGQGSVTDAELLRLKQEYEYEMKLQQLEYEAALKEQRLKNTIELQKTNPNSAQQQIEAEYKQELHEYELKLQGKEHEVQLKEQAAQQNRLLEQQKSAYELKLQQKETELLLEKQALEQERLLQQKDKTLEQQKHEYELKLKEKDYEYELKLLQLKHQLELEKLKQKTIAPANNASPRSGMVIPSESETRTVVVERSPSVPPAAIDNRRLERIENQLEDLTTAVLAQNIAQTIDNATQSPKETTTTIIVDSTNTSVLRLQNEALKLRIQELEIEKRALANQKGKTDTITTVQIDSVMVGDAVAQQQLEEKSKSLRFQQEMNQKLLTKLALLEQQNMAQQAAMDSLSQLTISTTTTSDLNAFLNEGQPTYVTKVFFDPGKTALTLQGKETVSTLVRALKNYPNIKFLIKGFASKTGNPTTNQRLSAERAQEVGNYLKQLGIAAARIKITPLGDTESSASNELDRRAEVHLVK